MIFGRLFCLDRDQLAFIQCLSFPASPKQEVVGNEQSLSINAGNSFCLVPTKGFVANNIEITPQDLQEG